MAAIETNVANGAESTLSSTLSSGATTINVTSTAAFPSVPFYAVIDPDVDASREVILVDSSKTATTFVLSGASKRGQDGTTDTTHSSGAKVVCVPVAALWTDINDRVDAKAADADVVKLTGDQTVAGTKTFSTNPLLADGSAAVSTNVADAAYEPLGHTHRFESGSVLTFESTSSTTATDLTTLGPAVSMDVPASGRVLVIIQAWVRNATTSTPAYMGFALSGANTAAASTDGALVSDRTETGDYLTLNAYVPVAGLTPGSTTFTAKYWVDGGAGWYGRRRIIVLPG